MPQMHECELKNSPPAILSSHCSPLYSLWMSLKEKAGSFPCDWLKPWSSFVRPSDSVLRWDEKKKHVCVCVVKPGTDSWHLMAFLAAGVFERILSKGWILVTSFHRSCLSVKQPAGPAVCCTHTLTQCREPIQKCCDIHASQQNRALDSCSLKATIWNVALCPGPPPPLFTACFNKSLEDRCAALIGHLHLWDFNEAN